VLRLCNRLPAFWRCSLESRVAGRVVVHLACGR
jgi:hypothetical protein